MSQKSSDKEVEGDENGVSKEGSEKRAAKAAKILEQQANGIACI